MSETIHQVSEVSRRIKALLEKDLPLKNFLMEGEVSNFRASKHWYFSLKDEESSINCAVWSSTISKLNFQPKNGDKIVAKCSLGYYGPHNSITITITALRMQGMGDLLLKLQELKQRLEKEGLFSVEHKKPIPKYPQRIGIITGKDTAGKADMIRTLNRRWPMAEQRFYECPVQGNSSIPFIIQAIESADRDENDVLILARGGGSFEDLFIFNDEQIVRTVFACKTAIVTGVGHETDTTLVDYASDLRANTPTGAAEAVSPDQYELRNQLRHLQNRISKQMLYRLHLKQQGLKTLRQNRYLENPELLYRDQSYRLDQFQWSLKAQRESRLKLRNQWLELHHSFSLAIKTISHRYQQELLEHRQFLFQQVKNQLHLEKNTLSQQQDHLRSSVDLTYKQKAQSFQSFLQLLDAYSPLKVLDRGYSILLKENTLVHSINQINEDDILETRVKDGRILSKVIKKENQSWKN